MNPENQSYYKVTYNNLRWLRVNLTFLEILAKRLGGAVVKRISFDE